MTVEQNISYENVPGRLWANGWESLAWKKNLFGQGMRLPGGRLQDELQRIYAQTHITILFVTHDISEALKLGTKVLVMDQGKIHQYDVPEQILRSPATEFVKQLVERKCRTCIRV